ncbi:hypothetical protein F2Q70_00009610 [Brassica cretica]|uniref:Uncharacterized protein n=1 Tax=Brassica cretica TaxID=69181 RepID=A0A8S9MCJ4_BRACR|nr:hypothetical protein F2Q70_00009610 [Brassica cretica]
MFAFGEEQVGIRVTEDQNSSCISKIINALEEEEIAFNKASTFGKLLAIARETPILGSFWAFPYIQTIEGGATKADVIWMRDEAKKENITCKTASANPKQPVSHAIDADNNISKLC